LILNKLRGILPRSDRPEHDEREEAVERGEEEDSAFLGSLVEVSDDDTDGAVGAEEWLA